MEEEHRKGTWDSVKMKGGYAVAKAGIGIEMVCSGRSIGSLAGGCIDRTFE